jgi:galactokinase
VVCDTAKPRELVGSEYNLLRSQCEQGAQLLGVKALGEVDLATLEANREKFTDEEIYWRCYYIVNENARVLQSAAALREGDLARLGRLMNESFRQARDYYGISVRELDVMWELCGEFPDCYGARIVGAGFGGAMLAVCDPAAAAHLIRYLAPRYERRTDRTPNLFPTPPSPGAGYLAE